jgi:inosine-uridine nucleoside N-ribohydrolase
VSPRETASRPGRSIHIDTDPVLDDLLALALALCSPELRVRSVTTVAGNASLEAVTHNAASFLDLAGVEVPVGAGASRPLQLPRVGAEIIHGVDGRRGLALPAEAERTERSAADLLRSSLEGGGVEQLVAIGPLTNVAELWMRTPELLRGVEVVWMGGTLGRGNVTPLAEFNAYADPHALALLLDSDVPLRIIGLDVTHQVVLRPAELEPGLFGEDDLGRFLEGTLRALMEGERPIHGEAMAPLHDPCAIAAAISPNLFRYEERYLGVCVEPGRERGRLLDRPGAQPGRARRPVLFASEALQADIIGLFLERLTTWGGERAER